MSISLAVKQYDNVPLDTLIKVFSHYQLKPYSCWLDSGTLAKQTHPNSVETKNTGGQLLGKEYESTHHAQNNRYHILVHSPRLSFDFKHGKGHLNSIWFDNPPNSEISQQLKKTQQIVEELTCPFDMLNCLHEFFKGCIDKEPLKNISQPFIAGALGSFGYDLNVHLNNIQDDDPDEFDLSDLCIGFYTNSIIYDSHLEQLFVYYENDDIGYTDTFEKILNSRVSGDRFRLTENWQANMDKSFYCGQLQRIHDYLIAGDCYQVNFAQRFSAAYQGDEFQAYLLLREVNNAPFSAFMRYRDSTVLSLSPERFLSLKNKQVETKPIKGTRKRDKNLELDAKLSEELLASDKDKAENLMIVDLLRNDLSKYCEPHSVKVPELFKLESYPAVHHMVSTVIATLKQNATPFDLLKGAFPGGSITGCPKLRSMQIIQELEPNKRSIYCGSIGYIGVRDDMDTNICIRTLLAERGQLHCWAGGGIVFDSVASDEYQESLDKVNKILPILEDRV